MSQSTSVKASITARSSGEGISHVATISVDATLTNGTDADKADLCYYRLLTIPYASTPATLNLYDGSELDINGDPLVLREVVAINIENQSDDHDATVTFDFGSGTDTWTEPLLRGGHIQKFAPGNDGYGVESGDAPHITIDIVDGTNVDVKVLIIGRSLS